MAVRDALYSVIDFRMQDRVRPEFHPKEIKMTNEQQQMAEEVRALSAELTAIKARAASENREMTAAENQAYNAKAGRMVSVHEQFQALTPESTRVIQAGIDAFMHPEKRLSGVSAPVAVPAAGSQPVRGSGPRLTADYRDAFYTYLGSNGTKAFSQLLYPIAAVTKEGLGVCGGNGGDGLRQGWLQLLDESGFDSA